MIESPSFLNTPPKRAMSNLIDRDNIPYACIYKHVLTYYIKLQFDMNLIIRDEKNDLNESNIITEQ